MSTTRPSKYGESFIEWFEWIIHEAEIYDYGRYPVKGVGAWMPYGFKLRKNVENLIRRLLEETGHEEILLPTLIPETLFKKESEHVRGFEGEVFWVTKAGLEELDVKLVLRPTSETVLSFMESMWIKSYKQLPKKYFQIVSMFRYETKMTKPMIRLREVTMFKEAHTVHENFEDSERQILEAIDIYKKFFDMLGIPYKISRRPQWDKFAGAIYTISFDTIMPDGRVLQIATVHNLGQTFTKVFEVRIQRKDETIDYAWQTSYGISERVIATIIAYHSDDRGLIIPPIVAPYQIVVVPIPGKTEDETKRIVEYAHSIAKMLSDAGFRVRVDDREDLRPVEKYFEWELKGVPLRVEVGSKELASHKVTLCRRDKMERITVTLSELIDTVKNILEDIMNNLRERAWKWFLERVKQFDSLDEAIKFVREVGGIAEIPWCGRESCAKIVEEQYEGISIIGIPLVGVVENVDVSAKRCAVCGRQAVTVVRIGRKY